MGAAVGAPVRGGTGVHGAVGASVPIGGSTLISGSAVCPSGGERGLTKVATGVAGGCCVSVGRKGVTEGRWTRTWVGIGDIGAVSSHTSRKPPNTMAMLTSVTTRGTRN